MMKYYLEETSLNVLMKNQSYVSISHWINSEVRINKDFEKNYASNDAKILLVKGTAGKLTFVSLYRLTVISRVEKHFSQRAATLLMTTIAGLLREEDKAGWNGEEFGPPQRMAWSKKRSLAK